MDTPNLVDPLLYHSSYVNKNPEKVLKIEFWKKFDFLNFMCNIFIPITVLIFVLFVLKNRYVNKQRHISSTLGGIYIPPESSSISINKHLLQHMLKCLNFFRF